MTKTEKQNAAIARVLSNDPLTTIIEAVTETSVLADELHDCLHGNNTAIGVIVHESQKDMVRDSEYAISESGFEFTRFLISAIRQYALEVAIKKGYYDEP